MLPELKEVKETEKVGPDTAGWYGSSVFSVNGAPRVYFPFKENKVLQVTITVPLSCPCEVTHLHCSAWENLGTKIILSG